jgi:hypothetical protein
MAEKPPERPTASVVEYGILQRPVAEPLPPRSMGPAVRIRLRPSPWLPSLEFCRQHPFVDFIIAEYKKGGKKKTAADVRNAKNQLEGLVLDHFPLERWRFSVRTTPQTWCDRTLRATFFGTFTAEEQAQWRLEKRKDYDERMARGLQRRAREEQAKRLAAIEQSRRLRG